MEYIRLVLHFLMHPRALASRLFKETPEKILVRELFDYQNQDIEELRSVIKKLFIARKELPVALAVLIPYFFITFGIIYFVTLKLAFVGN